MNDGLVDERIAREVLNGLKEIAKRDFRVNGDLKEQSERIILKPLINFTFYFVTF